MNILSSNPPLLQNYTNLLFTQSPPPPPPPSNEVVSEIQLPFVDIASLDAMSGDIRKACEATICKAARDWGFFQVVNHGVRLEVMDNMRSEGKKLFESAFETKAGGCGCYRWGTPTATSLTQFSWSEAFHIPVETQGQKLARPCAHHSTSPSLRDALEEYACAMSRVGRMIGRVLQTRVVTTNDEDEKMFGEEGTQYVRLNRYPPCSVESHHLFGLVPHTDSGLLTIVWQDSVGGLQVKKDSKWVAVKPNPDALIINVGDMLQAWSNDLYKSVEHKVMVNSMVERHSLAYFLCPSDEAVIGREGDSKYRRFSFGEYRDRVKEDVSTTGYKLGLTRFIR